MTENLKLFMVMLGCTPKGRVTEQHDIFFGIAEKIGDLRIQFNKFWPEAAGKLHIDAWREVTVVDNYSIEIVAREQEITDDLNLYFINLGGYKEGEFEEYHYKMLTVATKMSTAIKLSKKTAFYKHCGFKGAETHLDEKFGIDVDDAHKVSDLLDFDTKSKYQIKFNLLSESAEQDELHIGYLTVKAK